MPDPEEKKELGGLARSIDSLFASPTPDSSLPEEESPADAFPVPVPVPEDLTLDSGPGEAEPPLPEAQPPGAPEHSAAEAADDPPAEGTEARLEDVTPSETMHLPADAPPEVEAAGEEVAESEPAAEDAPPAPGAEAEEPTPLDLAVESYIAGGGDTVRVRSLAKQHAAVREYDPIARAVVRLVEIAYGEESEAMLLARELLTPIVRHRLIQQIGAEHDPSSRQRYYDVCTKLGVDMAGAIRDGLADAPDRFARRAYFDALVTMGEVARPVIEAMSESENRFHARNAVAILGELGGERAIPLVEGALSNTDAKVRREAILSLARLGSKQSGEVIVGRLVDDTDESVRRAAIVAAGELRILRALRPLIELLESRYEPDDVLPILNALGQLADPGAVPAIEKHAVRDAFGKPRTNVRIAAYQALHHIGTPHARRLLNKAVSDKDPQVKAVVKGFLHMR